MYTYIHNIIYMCIPSRPELLDFLLFGRTILAIQQLGSEGYTLGFHPCEMTQNGSRQHGFIRNVPKWGQYPVGVFPGCNTRTLRLDLFGQSTQEVLGTLTQE